MTAEFVHLHVHTQYSMLDSSIRLKPLIKKAKSLGMPAVAVTDHTNMFCAIQLHKECKDAGVKPIIGCEVNYTPGSRTDASDKTARHLVLLASSQDGYRNLVRLVSRAWVDAPAGLPPRIDSELLAAHREGIVGLSGCMAGQIAQEVLLRGEGAGRIALAQLRDVFDKGKFFVELQDHGLPEQRPLNEILRGLAADLAVPVVASNDCHYLDRENSDAQTVLQCIGSGRTLDEARRVHHGSHDIYLRSPAEMAQLFSGCPEAISNTLLVSEMCAGQVNPLSAPKLPRFQVPDGSTEDDFMRELSRRRLAERISELRALGQKIDEHVYRERLEMEIDVICKMGFSGYFLIVQDFITWAKENGVPVGPGRGSGAGSIVAYSLRITDLDPIPYGLLFERFLNPERVSMPDFDVDFCMDRRDLVIDYVREKYGRQSVGQIATFHLLKSKSVVRDVGRVMGMTPQDAGRIASLVPEPVQGKSVPIDKAMEQEPRLKEAYDEGPQIKILLDTAMQLEDLTRHAGMHAAGVVLSEGPLWDHVPVFCPEPGVYVTQYHKDDVEAAGLVKFDFLGLKTLTVIDIATKLINKRPDRVGQPFRIEAIVLDDAATFTLLQSGETTNVFQLESSGMQSLFKQLRPDCFEDIVAAVALYRPGPLGSGMVEDFVQRKHGRVKVAYPHACLEKILKETYGVIVYQEQVMQAAQEMGGYTLGGADLLRRAMGKKKAEEMAKHKSIFVDGAKAQGIAEEDAVRVFELIDFFSGYGFNKSHSAAYALITYQTAYLKAHFPVEFACATLSADKEKIDKVVRTVAEAKSMGIVVRPPDVNDSEIDFTVVYTKDGTEEFKPKRKKTEPVAAHGKVRDPYGPEIRFGLGGVKGIGSAALEAIFEVRKEDPFLDLFDFSSRVDLRRVNKAVAEALVQCGAFDGAHKGHGIGRSSAFGAIDGAIERGKKAAAERDSGQTNLFGLLAESDPKSEAGVRSVVVANYPRIDQWDQREVLQRERNTLGFYVSGHPLDRYAAELKRIASNNTESLPGVKEGSKVTVGGSVEAFRERTTKTGHKIAFFELEDPFGRVEVIVRPRLLEKEDVRKTLTSGEPVLAVGLLQFEQDRGGGGGGQAAGGGDDAPAETPTAPKLVLEEVSLISQAIRKKAKGIRVKLRVGKFHSDQLKELRKTLEKHPGSCPVTLEISEDTWLFRMPSVGLSVDPSDSLRSNLERLFGENVCELR